MNEPSVHLRGLQARDVDAVLAVQSAAPEAAQWKREAFEAILQGGSERLILAERTPAIVGFASYRVIAPEAEILNIAVLPAFRRQGFGARLLQEVMRIARDCGVSDMFLEVREDNREAIRLYERFGFRVTGRRRDYYRDPPADALMLRCSIAEREDRASASSVRISNRPKK